MAGTINGGVKAANSFGAGIANPDAKLNTKELTRLTKEIQTPGMPAEVAAVVKRKLEGQIRESVDLLTSRAGSAISKKVMPALHIAIGEALLAVGKKDGGLPVDENGDATNERAADLINQLVGNSKTMGVSETIEFLKDAGGAAKFRVDDPAGMDTLLIRLGEAQRYLLEQSKKPKSKWVP
jgi:uncharacterized protein (DUF885 family)